LRSTFWKGVAAYLLPTFPLGYFWHLTTFAKQYAALEMLRDNPFIPLGLGSMAIQAAVFSWAYPRLFDTARDRWIASGVRAAAVFGLLAWSFTTLAVAAKYRSASVGDFMILESSFTALQFFVTGLLLALAHRRAAA
jgi:hypothetical protein